MAIDPKPSGLFYPDYWGIETAYLEALKNIVQNEVDELNDVLRAHTLTAPIVSDTFGGEVLAAHVDIGMLKGSWNPHDTAPNGGPVRIRICASDFGTSQIFEEERRAISQDNTAGGKRTLTASVFLFFHREVFRDDDDSVQAAREEMALTQASYWLRLGCLNNAYYYSFQIDSYEQNGPTPDGEDVPEDVPHPYKDTLSQCFARRGLVGRMPEHYGGSEETVGLQFLHSGWVG